MSSFLSSASITLVLLSILSLSTAYLVDTDGDRILNGGKYYIIPVHTTGGGGGLTYTQKKSPHFITQEKLENSPGTPVKIFSPVYTHLITLDQHVSLAFKGPTPSDESLIWRQTQIEDVTNTLTRKLYITAGGKDPIIAHIPFSITKTDKSLLPIYELKYSPTGEKVYNVGLYEDDGLLGITQYPTKVSFKKAFNVLELSSTS